jgi:RNA polymerase sigma-70 factor, ECF subfamily
MTGSAADAEDLLQETYLRWRQASQDDIRTPRAFVTTVISRLAINHLESARVRREQYVGSRLRLSTSVAVTKAVGLRLTVEAAH